MSLPHASGNRSRCEAASFRSRAQLTNPQRQAPGIRNTTLHPLADSRCRPTQRVGSSLGVSNNRRDTLCPGQKSFPTFISVVVAQVYSCDSLDTSALVVQRRINNMRRKPESGHAASDSPANIMQSPRLQLDRIGIIYTTLNRLLSSQLDHFRIDQPLRLRKSRNGRLAVGRQEQILVSLNFWDSPNDFDSGRRKCNFVRLIVLCPLARDCPSGSLRLEIHLGKPCTCHFRSALPSKEKQLRECTKRPSLAFCRQPKQSNLIVGQNSISALIFRRSLNVSAWGCVDHIPLDRPIEEFTKNGMDSIGARRCPAINDLVKQINDIATGYRLDVSAPPSRLDLIFDEPSRFLPGASAILHIDMSIEELVENRLYAIPFIRSCSLCGRFLITRITTFRDCAQRGTGCLPGLRETICGKGANRHLAWPSAESITDCPRLQT